MFHVSSAHAFHIQCLHAPSRCVEENVNDEAKDVWDDGCEEDVFCVFGASICAFEISPTEEQCQSGNHKTENVLLSESRGCEGPGVAPGDAGNDGEEWRAIAGPSEGRKWSKVWLDSGIEKSEGDQRHEK